MTKFEKVNKALMDKTYDTGNYVRLTKNVFAGSKGKYATQNVITNNISTITYKTLKEVINEFDLQIN